MVSLVNGCADRLERVDSSSGRLSIYFRSNGTREPDVVIEHGYDVLEGIKTGEICVEKNGFAKEREIVEERYSHLTGEGRTLRNLAYVFLLEHSFFYLVKSGGRTIKVMSKTDLERKAASLINPAGGLNRKVTVEEERDLFESFQHYKRGVHENAVRVLGGRGRVRREVVLEMVDNYKTARCFIDGIAGMNMGLIYAMTKNVEEEFRSEARGSASVSLLRAIHGFDPYERFRFSTYACSIIFKDVARTVRREKIRKWEYGMPLEGYVESDRMLNKRRRDEVTVQTELLREILGDENNPAGLNERERGVVERRFGFNGHEATTLEEVGVFFGVTKERIRQVQEKAERKIRSVFRKEYSSRYE